MRWKIISLCAALITATSAHILTIDNGFIIQPPENETYNPEYYNSTIAKVEEIDNNEIEVAVIPKVFSESIPINSRQTRETKEDETLQQSKEVESNEIQKTEENTLPPKSDESDPQGNPKSEAVTNENLDSKEPKSNENPDSREHESSNKPNSGEALSVESNTQEPIKGSSNEGSCATDSGETTAESCGNNQERLVQTSYGPVKGYIWQDTSDIIGFFDIPYGKIEGPFEAPTAPQSWLDVHVVTSHGKICPQLQNEEYIGRTDCLTLSIFIPKDAVNVSVLFHIHDASISKSADPMIYGPDYLVSKGVILVLPNYRVGPMGFLCMQNETAPGNAGLKDLSLALEWVNDNIQLFGGDPANIVVSGDGTAGAFAGYLALSSRSRHYINKVITESGSALSNLALDRDPIKTAYALADKIKSHAADDAAIFNNTFKEAELETIIKSAKDMKFNPCLELGMEPFMNDTPWKMLHDRKFDTIFMIGSASYAGAHEAVFIMVDFLEQLNANFSDFLPEDLVFKDNNERGKIAEKLREQYFGENNINSSHVKELSLWYTDASFLGPGIRLARPLVQAGATVYLYEFEFVGSLNRELEAMNKAVPGAVRSDILGYLFHKDKTTVEEGSPEEQMINLMVDLWISFIIDGKPHAENVEWNELKKADDSEEEWLLISSEPKAMKGVHLDRQRLWTSVYDEHFIENNAALRFPPCHSIAILSLIVCWISKKS